MILITSHVTSFQYRKIFCCPPDADLEKASLENMPANLYESVCVPDLGDFLGYQSSSATNNNNPSSNSDSKVSRADNNPQQVATTNHSSISIPSPAVAMPSRHNYQGEGEWLLSFFFSFLSRAWFFFYIFFIQQFVTFLLDKDNRYLATRSRAFYLEPQKKTFSSFFIYLLNCWNVKQFDVV